MKKKVYKILTSYYAPDLVKSEIAGQSITKLFVEGDTVIGRGYDDNTIIVDDRYVFPEEYLEKSDELSYLKKDSRFKDSINHIKQKAVNLSDKEKEKLDSVGDNVQDVIERKTKMRLSKETNYYKNGALLGLGSGIFLALYLRKNVWVLGLLGAALGGYVSNQIYKSKEGKNDVKPVKTE